MLIILLQDIEKLGKKNDVVKVKPGYARNFLIPKKLAKIATKQELKLLEIRKEKERLKAEKELKQAKILISQLNNLKVSIPVKLGKKQELFERITAKKIADKLKELGYKIDKSQIKLAENIKQLGEYSIKIKIKPDLQAKIKIEIKPEI